MNNRARRILKWSPLFIGVSFTLLACGHSKGDSEWILRQDPLVQKAILSTASRSELDSPVGTPNEAEEYADVYSSLYPDRLTDAISKDELENVVLKVTRTFGNTKIRMSDLPITSIAAEAKSKPWSSWWFPMSERELFEAQDHRSPLEKYDLYRKSKFRREGSAADEERNKFSPRSVSWAGLCSEWALASTLFLEPKNQVLKGLRSGLFVRNTSVEFSPYDLKALLIKTFEGVPDSDLDYYGQKFTGDQDGWIHPDLFPEQFHRFVEVQLFEKKQAFVMDHDAGLEIWSVPVFRANYRLEEVAGNKNAVRVRMWIYSAAPLNPNEKYNVGTKELMREYQYVLIGTRSGDDLEVTSGVWIRGENGVDSRKDHPDYVIAMPRFDRTKRSSFNSFIDVDVVDDILEGSF